MARRPGKAAAPDDVALVPKKMRKSEVIEVSARRPPTRHLGPLGYVVSFARRPQTDATAVREASERVKQLLARRDALNKLHGRKKGGVAR